MDLGLQGAVALVVGGGGLIGRAVAALLHAEGAQVVLASRSLDRLQQVAQSIDPSVGAVTIDTGDQVAVDRAIAEVIDRYGSIDILINTAAPSARTLDPARNGDPIQVTAAFEAKAMGYLRCINAVLPQMQAAGYGRIVNISGQNAYITGSITGSVRNAAVIVLSKNIADSVAGTGITVNVVNPGIVTDDPAISVAAGTSGQSSPDQVASVIVFLASRLAAATSGESISVGHRVRGVAAF